MKEDIVPATVIAEGDYSGLTWVGDVFVSTRPTDSVARESVIAVNAESGEEQLVTPDGSPCSTSHYEEPQPLLDGRVSLVASCWEDQNSVRVIAIDPASGAAETMIEQIDAAPSTLSWAPDERNAVLGDSPGLCSSIRWLTPAGEDVRDVIVGEGSDSWSLADLWEFYEEQREALSGEDYDPATYPSDCTQVGGMALYPRWSPNGESIAFLASPESVGLRDMEPRLFAPFELWMMSGDGANPHRVFGDIVAPGGVAWSPQGGCIALSGTIQNQVGTWILDLDEGSLTRFEPHGLGSISWSADGDQIAGLVSAPDEVLESTRTIVVFDVGDRHPGCQS